jgi:hypothetical protein
VDAAASAAELLAGRFANWGRRANTRECGSACTGRLGARGGNLKKQEQAMKVYPLAFGVVLVLALASQGEAQTVHLFGPLGPPPNPLRAAAVCDPCSDPFLDYQSGATFAPGVSYYGGSATFGAGIPGAGDCNSCQTGYPPVISTPAPVISTPAPVISTPAPVISTPAPVTSYRPITHLPSSSYTVPTQSYWSGGRLYSSGASYRVVAPAAP